MKIDELRIEHIVVGSGAAGLQAALQLHQHGETDVAVVTERMNAGTSRNTGSDKQTYYKLSLAGGDMDCVGAMAEDLFAGQCVDGDHALCEAALSVRSFFRLVESGVPFPSTIFGEYMGYKTDHDRGRRATSAGPYTSRLMTECLERSVKEKGIRILDQMQLIHLLVKDGILRGALCLDKQEKEEPAYLLIWCDDLILATGGPAGMYHDSVYPVSQLGASGLAFEAGAKGKNLTEWQFGMASLYPRWNVSGTYMQVLPRFVSTAANGTDEREFLAEYFDSPEQMLSCIFLKGYQWPFDVNKIYGGSSVIDLLVYQETIVKGRRVFLDFTKNPGQGAVPFESLEPEVYDYLNRADALFGTPIERLKQMNEPAIQFYLDHQVNLFSDKLEIAVCAQHNNGGISTDSYWETDIQGLFAVGEVCATHGVTRPGGTALNAGQVGAARAAECIRLRKLHKKKKEDSQEHLIKELRAEALDFIEIPELVVGDDSLTAIWERAAKRMSAYGGMIRNQRDLKKELDMTNHELIHYQELVSRPAVHQLPLYYRLRDMLISQKVYLWAMLDYMECGGGSRGSALYTEEDAGLPDPRLPDLYRCRLDGSAHAGIIQEILWKEDGCDVTWRPVRPIPEVDYFFENQWKLYRERQHGFCFQFS